MSILGSVKNDPLKFKKKSIEKKTIRKLEKNNIYNNEKTKPTFIFGGKDAPFLCVAW